MDSIINSTTLFQLTDTPYSGIRRTLPTFHKSMTLDETISAKRRRGNRMRKTRRQIILLSLDAKTLNNSINVYLGCSSPPASSALLDCGSFRSTKYSPLSAHAYRSRCARRTLAINLNGFCFRSNLFRQFRLIVLK